MWNSKPQLKIYSYINNSFVLQAIIDDYKSCSWNRSKYSAGNFTIEINYNIPNAQLFQKGQFIQFSDDGRDFGFIENISDNVGASGKASQTRTITGYDCRYLFKRRIIKSLNSTDTWTMTDCGELVMRNLIADQCGVNAETKRRLPITNTIGESGIGEEYTCSEAYSNLYDTLVTIATQSKIMWKVVFDGEKLVLDFTQGEDKSATVRLDTDYESLANGQFSDSLGSYTNAVYVGGQGYSGSREIYEGESAIDNASPSGFDRFESWDDSSTLTEESEYATEAESVLNQYSQTLMLTGAGLAKCPYVYGEQYDVGDTVTVKFNQIEVTVEIQSVTEYWAKGQYRLDFNFGKPTRTLSSQIELLLSKIQSANANAKTTTCTAVKYYNVATETEQSADEVTYDTLGFTGAVGTGKTFTLHLSGQTGAKTYMVYVKNLTGTGKLILTTGVSGSASLALETGSYCVEVYVDTDGNVSSGTMTTNTVESGNTNAVTSGAVASALSGYVPASSVVDSVQSGNMNPVTSNAAAGAIKAVFPDYTKRELIYNSVSSTIWFSSFTFPKDGLLVCSGYGRNSQTSYIGFSIDGYKTYDQGSTDEWIHLECYAKKGTVVDLQIVLSVVNSGLYFIPCE